MSYAVGENMMSVEPNFNYGVIYAVGDDARIHVLSHGYIPDDLDQEIPLIESEIESTQSPGIYKGHFRYDSGNGEVDDGYWDISMGTLLYEIPSIKDKNDE